MGDFQYQCVFFPLLTLLLITDLANTQLHFASLGNWGSGNSVQTSVATTLKEKAKENKISFIVSPGSNFISGSVSGLNDKLWDSSFNNPYEGPELHLPFFTVLGGDDWRGNYTAMAMKSLEDYSNPKANGSGPKWTLPNWFYHYGLHFQDASGTTTSSVPKS